MKATGDIEVHSEGVEDRTPAWLRALILVVWVVGLTLVVILAVYFGIGRIVRPIANRFGRWIDPQTREEAKQDAEIIERGGVSEQFSRSTQIRRVRNVAYRQALNQETQKIRARQARSH